MCLTWKEPILALKLAEFNIGVTAIGLIFSMDTITYTATSFILNFVSESKDGKKYARF